MHLDGYQNRLVSIDNNFFDRTTKGTKAMKNGLNGVKNEPVATELHKQIIRKSVTGKIVPISVENIWNVDPADMQTISKYNKSNKIIRVPLCFSCLQYIWLGCSIERYERKFVNAFMNELKLNSKRSKHCRKLKI